MYSVILLAAMTAGENVPEFHFKGGCYGGCYGSCYGYRHGCHGGFYAGHGSCYGACYGGCYGVGYRGWSGCWGSSYSGYGPGYACCGGCYGSSYAACCGGCYGSYSCYGGCCGGNGCSGYGGVYLSGYNCCGGCCGYTSPAFGVSMTPVGVPMGAPVTGGKVISKVEAAPQTNRAQVAFVLPEGAKLFVDGVAIPNAAEQKSFRTPELKVGEKYFYDLRVEVTKEGKTLTGNRRIYVKAGESVTEDLTTVEMKTEVQVTSR